MASCHANFYQLRRHEEKEKRRKKNYPPIHVYEIMIQIFPKRKQIIKASLLSMHSISFFHCFRPKKIKNKVKKKTNEEEKRTKQEKKSFHFLKGGLISISRSEREIKKEEDRDRDAIHKSSCMLCVLKEEKNRWF